MARTDPHPMIEDLECYVAESDYLLSARRLWEHGVMGQVDVTAGTISATDWALQVPRYIDVITWVDGVETWVGTLEDVESLQNHDEIVPVTYTPVPAPDTERLFPLKDSTGWRRQGQVIQLLRNVERYLYRLSHRQAVRGLVPSFWPSGLDMVGAPGVLAVPGLYSKLEQHLRQHPPARHTAMHWHEHLKRAQMRGMKQEELERSGLLDWLTYQHQFAPASRWTPQDLLNAIDLTPMRLSMMAVTEQLASPLVLEKVIKPPAKLAPVREVKRPQMGQRRTVTAYDRVLGYRIERIQHDTLWGTESHWQAVTYDGEPIANRRGSMLLSSPEVASQLAAHHAQRRLPKSKVAELWRSYAWSGGEEYREWLVTLPWYPQSVTENHFNLRNVLAHVRCDQRKDSTGRRILLIHELQSDWAQEWSRQRRYNTDKGLPPDHDTLTPEPPFGRDWPALVLKLMLLHTAWWKLDGLAWATGDQLVMRFGSGKQWLITLYDERLPREANRLLAVHGAKVVPLSLPRWESNDSAQMSSDPGESLDDEVLVHGVILDAATRAAIAKRGFAAWG